MRLIRKKFNHYINIDTEIDLNRVDNYNMYIVYYINCTINKNYCEWLINQLNYVYRWNATIYVIATINKANEAKFIEIVKRFFPNVIVECSYEHEFEYRGILKVWELGQKYNKHNDIILYLHSKGLTHHQHYYQNKKDNYNAILLRINKIYEIFNIFPKIDKIGYFSGGFGWIWYNFWYARGSYISTVEKPVLTSRRHYYEDWLARQVATGTLYPSKEGDNTYNNTLHSCYGFYTDGKIIANIGSYFCPGANKCFNI